MPQPLKERLEALYQRWHHPRYLGTDPLVLVREALPEDQEITAFLASCLAVGRASLVVKAGRELIGHIGTPLTRKLAEAQPGQWQYVLQGFGYRFFSAGRVAALLDSLGVVLRKHETLQAAWRSTKVAGWPALEAFGSLFHRNEIDLGILVPVAGSGGASKRLNLFLRWMVRSDEVDPGLWTVLTPAQLFMPVDTHVLQWARAEGLTQRKNADRTACWEITRVLQTVSPEDPLRYDFAITRAGMESKNTLY